jgi:hypothetical protein
MRIYTWILGLIGSAALAVGLGAWHPWFVHAAQATRVQATATGPAVNPDAITWAQATRVAPGLARQPRWLPPGISQSQLIRDPAHGVLLANYTGGRWTLQIQEFPGPTRVSNPNEVPSVLAGRPVMVASWQTPNPYTGVSTHLNDVAFELNGNSYDVLGINVPLATVEHVAVSLLPQKHP